MTSSPTQARCARVALVGSDPLTRAGLRAVLEEPAQSDEHEIVVVGESRGGSDGIDLVRAHRPSVALVEAEMPGIDGVHFAERVAADASLRDTRVIMLAGAASAASVARSAAAGASGFVLRSCAPDELRTAVRTVTRGYSYLSPQVTGSVLLRLGNLERRRDTKAIDAIASLTDRERDVLRAVADCLCNKDIGDRLGVSEATVRTHVSRMLAAFGMRNRCGLVALAHRGGLVEF